MCFSHPIRMEVIAHEATHLAWAWVLMHPRSFRHIQEFSRQGGTQQEFLATLVEEIVGTLGPWLGTLERESQKAPAK